MNDNNIPESRPQNRQTTTWHPNRAYIQLTPTIVIDSCFPGGNIASAAIVNPSPLTIEIEGNTDVNLDNSSKYWLYFRIRGFRKDRPIKMVLKNANHLRKYMGQNRIRPYMVYRDEADDNWKPVLAPIQLCFNQNTQIYGSFVFQSPKYFREKKPTHSSNQLNQVREEKLASTCTTQENKRASCYFAMYYPYSFEDLSVFILNLKLKHQVNEYAQLCNRKTYFNEETIVYSFERRKIALLTITSVKNIESFSQKQPCISEQIFPNPKDRPFKLKNCPIVLVTARVHPSQTSSSYFIEGLVQFLFQDSKASQILKELFIFQIIPMLNPDGVEHGNFRFDHQMRNLNRYYGQSTIEKTPSIRAVELLINYFKNQNNEQNKYTQFYQETYCRLFMYSDIHGHTSALPSFIYGNYTDKIEHLIENKTFCKLLQYNFLPNGFSKSQSQFSKKNMKIQQKHDQFSKLCSGRVFAGRSQIPEQKIFHSYTLEVLPFWQEYFRRRNQVKCDQINAMEYARQLGRTYGISILDLLDLNPDSKFNQLDLAKMRRQVERQCLNEQSRKVLIYKKGDNLMEQSSNSDGGRSKGLLDKASVYLNQYISRWFGNPIYIKHLFSKADLIKQPKVNRFFQRISQLNKLSNLQLYESPRRQRDKTDKADKMKIQTQPKQLPKQVDTINPREKMIFVGRKQRSKIQTRINKQTIELQEDFTNLMNKNRIYDKQIDFSAYKKESMPKKDLPDSLQRYENQVINKISTFEQKRLQYNYQQKKLAFEIKVKELIPKMRMNSRIQTEMNNASQQLQSQYPSTVNQKIEKKARERSTPGRQFTANSNNQRPSFIEQFILKIKEERQNASLAQQKIDLNNELKNSKHAKSRRSIREQLQQQQKKIFPILKRNKIFTIVNDNQASQSPEGGVFGRVYESIIHTRKKGVDSQSNVDEIVLKTKKIIISQRKEEIIKQQLLKKSQKFGFADYKN